MQHRNFRCLLGFTCGLLFLVAAACDRAEPPAPAQADAAAAELAAMKADIQMLKDRAPSASVAMADVSFHWSNLWFAGQAKNWPLAAYYYNESRNHVRWLIRINPQPKGPDGALVDLKGIFDAVDTSTFAAVKAAIDKKNSADFAKAYAAALESCYSCHQAVGRPYIRPQIPTAVRDTIVNMNPVEAAPH